jgi:hypothetical protein
MALNLNLGDLPTGTGPNDLASLMPPAAAKFRASTETAGTFYSEEEGEEEDNDENTPYWEEDDWEPMTKAGKLRTPNMIRGELQRYMDASKETQKAILACMGVNSNSFRKFMDPKTYKNPWRATENSTYMAAARLLERERNKPKPHKNTTRTPAGKRKAGGEDDSEMAPAAKKEPGSKIEAWALMTKIASVDGVEGCPVFDSCPEIVKKASPRFRLCSFALRFL